MARISLFVLIALIGAGAFFWVAKKPVPATVPENRLISYNGADKTALQAKYGKTLIVYYSYTGITREAALKIQQQTGADLMPIITRDPYPDSSMLFITSIKEIRSGYLPPLLPLAASIADYDTIITGSPVWWYTMPPALNSFLSQAGLSGKTIAPFCTQGGNEGNYYKDLAAAAKGAQVLPLLVLKLPHKQPPAELDKAIGDWLANIKQRL